jgi:hypothetical protein
LKFKKWRTEEDKVLSLVILIPLASITFVFLTVLPPYKDKISFQSLTSPHIYAINSYDFKNGNIRYGLSFLPFVLVIVAAYSARNKYYKTFIYLVCSVQVFTAFSNDYYTLFSIPKYFSSQSQEERFANRTGTIWFRNNYDHGKVLISSLQHEPEITSWPMDYNSYIHEGNQDLWLETIKDPGSKVRWIFMYTEGFSHGKNMDSVSRQLNHYNASVDSFDLVYSDSIYLIYRNKNAAI